MWTSPRALALLLARWLKLPQVRVALILLCSSIGIQFYFARFERPEEIAVGWNQHLGAEYFNIARALLDGRGFADPFGEATGPTAWMPPLYPALLAAIMAVVRERPLAAVAVLTLTHLSLVSAGVTVYSIARKYARGVQPWLVAVILIAWLAAFNVWFFLITQDTWLFVLVVNVILVLIYRRIEFGETKTWAWTLVGGVLFLLSPTLIVPWLALIVYFAIEDRQWRKWCAIVGIAAAFGVPWAVRNAVVFHKFIPMKSNFGYDLYLANVLDDDGVYDNRVLLQHPFANPLTRFEYARLGEAAFNQHYQQLAIEQIRNQRPRVVRKVLNRAVSAVLYYRPIAVDERCGMLLFSRVVYCLPALGFLALALLSHRNRKLVDLCCLVTASYLASYVLIAFYVRYWLALTPIFLLIVFLGIDAVFCRIRETVTATRARSRRLSRPSDAV